MPNGWISQTRVGLQQAREIFATELSHNRATKAWVVVAIIAIAVTNTLMIWLLGQPVDLIFKRNYDPLIIILLGLGVVVVFNQLAHLFSRVYASILGLRFVGEVRNRLMSHLMLVSTPKANAFARGDLLSRLSHDSDELQRLLIEYPFYVLSHVVTIVSYLVMLFWLDWRLAAGALALSPIFIIHQRLFARRKREASSNFMQFNGLLLGFEQNLMHFLKAIVTLNAEGRLVKDHRRYFNDAYEWAVKERWLDGLFSTSLMALIYLGGIAIMFAGIWLIENDDMTPGAMVSFLIYLGYLSVPFRGLAEMPFHAQTGFAAANRLGEILTLQPEVNDAQLEKAFIPQGPITISVNELSFAYPGGSPLFKDVSFEIRPDETVAIVGASGVGKTSLMNLLIRLIKPTSGTIHFDGDDISQFTLQSVRDQISMVWQEDLLLPVSIRENLLLARPDATDEELFAACEDSGAARFIERLPNGLETRVGEQGIALSGGQQQMLSIARAFLRGAPILIMDEPSAALDSQSEQHLIESIHRLSKNRTTLIIAHRFSTIREADKVLFLNGDGTISIGKHEELMRDHEAYNAIVYWQIHQK